MWRGRGRSRLSDLRCRRRSKYRVPSCEYRVAKTKSHALGTRYSQLGTALMNRSDLIYDWNQVSALQVAPRGPVQLNDESLRDGLQSPSVRDPSIEEKIEILHLMESLGIDSLDLGLPGAGPRAQARRGGAGARNRPGAAEDQGQLRRPHAPERHPSHCRDRAEDRRAHRGGDLHRLQPHPPLHRRLDRRFPAAHHRERRQVCALAGAGGDVRHRGHLALRSRDHQAAVLDRHQRRSARHRGLRHLRPRHAHGRFRADAVRARRGGEALGRKHSRGLARPLRSRPGGGQLAGGAGRRRRLRARLRHRHRRTRRQHARWT